MTRNRHEADDAPGRTPLGQVVGTGLTLLLLAPAAAVLVSRVRWIIRLDQSGAAPGCSGADALVPVLQAGLPVVLLLLAIPAALLSLAGRASGWIWLGLALAAVVGLEVGLDRWAPECL